MIFVTINKKKNYYLVMIYLKNANFFLLKELISSRKIYIKYYYLEHMHKEILWFLKKNSNNLLIKINYLITIIEYLENKLVGSMNNLKMIGLIPKSYSMNINVNSVLKSYQDRMPIWKILSKIKIWYWHSMTAFLNCLWYSLRVLWRSMEINWVNRLLGPILY
jgi:hypothetical protein